MGVDMRTWIAITAFIIVIVSGCASLSYPAEGMNDVNGAPLRYQVVDKPITLSSSNRPLLNYYWTYTYTHSDMTIFAYVNNTQVVVKKSTGVVIWSGTLNKGQHQNLLKSQLGSPGVYEVNGTMPYGLLVGDHLSTYVMGYYALDYWGRGASTQFYSYQVKWGSTAYDPHVIVFSCEDNNYVEIRNTVTNTVIWNGTLNSGKRYDSSTINDMYLTVNSTKPVTLLSYTDQGYYVPACDTQRFTGKRFYTYAGKAGGWSEGASIIAYEDNTHATLRDTDTGQIIWNGVLNVGQIYNYNAGATGKFLTVESDKNVTFAIEPYGPYTNNYYHSLYVYDGASGTGIGKLFYHPALQAGSIAANLIVFSYQNNSLVKIYNPSGTVVWSGNMNAGQYYIYNVATAGVHKVESTGYASVLFDVGDLAGADFAPVFFSLNPIPIILTQTLNPKVISSGGQSGISVHVNDVVTSIWNADVKFNSTCGIVTPSSSKSDVSGNTISLFDAPQVNSKTVCSINATATKQGYVPGWDVDQITINGPDPATLYSYVFANPGVVKSQGTSQIRVMVTDGLNPVSNVQVNLSLSAGSASPMSGLTNANGEFSSVFTAPQTGANQTVVVITADAEKTGFQQGQGQTQVTVLPSGTTNPILTVQITPVPRQILALRTSTITVKVTDGTNPVQGVQVYLNATNGSLNPKSGLTNVNGEFQSVFTAPNVTRLTQVIIIASAEKSGYIPGSGQDVISVLPADITVNLTANPKVIYVRDKSEILLEASNPLVGGIDNASLTLYLTPNVGTITPSTGQTDAQGRFKAIYTPPPNLTYDQTVIIRANVSKPMFNVGHGQVDVKVVMYPVLYVSILPEKSIVKPGEKVTLRVTVQDAKSGAPVPNATVNLTSDKGSIQPKQGLTNSTGVVSAVFTAPITNISMDVNITAEAFKKNYTGGNDTISIRIEPVPRPVIRVRTPNGGENWTVDTSHDIWWEVSGGTGYIFSNVSYSPDGASGPWIPIVNDLNNTGVYKWRVPVIKTTFNAYIRVEVYDSEGANASDISDKGFTIFNPVDYQRVLDRVEVTPSDIVVNLKATVQFTAKGYDINGIEIPGLKFTWELSTPDLGTITPAGVYTSSNVETEGDVSATASSGGVTKTGYAHVKISKNARMLSKVTITPEVKEVLVNSTLDLFATAYDTQGQPIPDASFNWKISGNYGSIAPTTGNKTTLTALLKGYALISVTASYNGLQKSASVNISLVYELSGGTQKDTDQNKSNNSLLIAGGVVAGIAVAMVLFFYFFYWRRRGKQQQPKPVPFAFPPEPIGLTPEPTEYPETPQDTDIPPVIPPPVGMESTPAPVTEPEPATGMSVCPRCKNEIPPGIKFCNECGHKLF